MPIDDKRFKKFNQPENISTLAEKYQVSYHIFRQWLKPIEKKINLTHKKIFTPTELRIIIDHLGEYTIED